MTTKTAYARQLAAEELAEQTRDLSPEEREESRVENAISPLFDMWLRFEAVFGDRAIDRLDITDEDAEAAASKMAGCGSAGAAFAHLLRSIPNRRRQRVLSHMVDTVWAASGTQEAMSIAEIHARYARLPKGAV